jgi:hypothetical protein
MHLFHIYCKIKGWIHGDDISFKLIKTVHVYGKSMMKIKDSFYETLSPLFERHEDMAIFFLDLHLSNFFQHLDLHVSIFFSPCF